MNPFLELVGNRIFVCGALGWLVAQIIKTIIYAFLTGDFRAERMVGSGGMPSSHSSTVCGLATATLLEYGAGSFEFVITLFFAIVVMHDARGVRREAGNQAVIINEMMDFFKTLSADFPAEDKLKEFIGHTPLQVFVGGILGILVALAVFYI